MKVKTLRTAMAGAAALLATCFAIADNTNIIDEVAWVVGDEPIYRSEIEEMYQQAQYDGTTFKNNPYCAIPEQIAVEKLYLHQAKLTLSSRRKAPCATPWTNASISLSPTWGPKSVWKCSSANL